MERERSPIVYPAKMVTCHNTRKFLLYNWQPSFRSAHSCEVTKKQVAIDLTDLEISQHIIGTGAFASVYKARLRKSSGVFAGGANESVMLSSAESTIEVAVKVVHEHMAKYRYAEVDAGKRSKREVTKKGIHKRL